jgi:predicted AlkP superfamily pyrophosphatase or phosphodiesterase
MRNLIGTANALRRHYGLETYHEPDEEIVKWASSYRCIVTVLVDALGARLIDRYMDEDDFVRKYKRAEMETVYPPTTSAATTAFLDGKYPCETGWLAWHQYFSELQDEMILFLGRGEYSRVSYGSYAWEALPVKNLYDELNEQNVKADSIWPSFGHNGCETFAEQCDLALQLVQDQNLRYLYVYWDELDACMHSHGPSSRKARQMMKDISDILDQFAGKLPEDVGLMVIADHGQVDITCHILQEDQDLTKLLKREPSLEARVIGFTVKEGKQEEFRKRFEAKYHDSYLLYSHAEVMRKHLFGQGKEGKRFEEFIGDYMACAYTPFTLVWNERQILKGHHAGLMEDEKYIPLILYPGE